jgi:molybdate transport system ATP-binding protein
MTAAALDARATLDRRGFVLDARIDAAPGEVVALMGPSGAGKSTLLQVIAGLLRTAEGYVRVGGREMSSPAVHVPPHHRGTVLLGQDPHLFPHLSARANVAFGMQSAGLRARVARDRAEDWLERVGLAGYGDRRPAALSGGQQQRVALARALATSPALLLLDEPLTSLDPTTAADLRMVLAEQLSLAGTTTVLVTHDVVDAAALASRLMLLEDGRVTETGPVRRLLAAPTTAFGAAIAGVTRVAGLVANGTWRGAGWELPAPALSAGAAVALIAPSSVRLQTPESDRGRGAPPPLRWDARVERIEQTVAGARVHTTAPAVPVDVPVSVVAERGLRPGAVVPLELDPVSVRIVAQ